MKKQLLFIILALGLYASGQQNITLLQPETGSIWEGADNYTISWEAQNINLIKIEFSENDGDSWQLVEAAYPATATSYDWTVPAQPTDSARIRLSDIENPAIYSVSGLFTIPGPFITLVQPQILLEGNAYAIRWESSCIFHVDILFSVDDGRSWNTIFSMEESPPGIKNWSVPLATDNCLLKLMDAANPEMFTISAPFDIAAAPTINTAKYHGGSFDGYARSSNLTPELVILSPAGGETWNGNTEEWLTWEAENTFRILMLFSTDGGDTWPDTLQNLYPAEALKYLITVPNTPTNQARFKLVSQDMPGLEAESGDFVIPETFIEIQNNFASVYTGTPYPIFWESSGVSSVNILYSSDNAVTWNSIALSVQANRGIKNWTVPEPTKVAWIRVSDSTGGIMDEAGPFAIEDFPLPNPTKYHGGSFDGYAKSTNITPSLAITNPTGGEIWDGSSLQSLNWEAINTYRIMILFSINDGQTWPDTLQQLYPAEAGKLEITIPNTPTNAARFKLVSLDVEGLETVSESFVIPGPFITITNTFESLKTGTPYPILWESSGFNHVDVGYSPDGGTTWEIIALNVPATRGIKNWKVPEPTENGVILMADSLQEYYTQSETFTITALPEHNPVKYQGGSYDGYDKATLDLVTATCPPDTSVCEFSSPFLLGDATPPGGTFTGNGVNSNVFSPSIAGEGDHEITYHFTNFNGNTTTCTFFIHVKPSQLVEIPNGWTGISSFLIPDNPDIQEVFADMQNELVILYNLDGDVYYPGGNVYPENPWNMYSGYCLKSGGTVEMDFCGEYLEELNVTLDEGWNLVPMLSKTPVSSDFIFGFNDDIEIVKQVAGWKVLWKDMGINTLGFLNPGKAYFVYCTAPTTISYPYYDYQALPEQIPDKPIESPFELIAPSPVSHVIAFSEIATKQLRDGDILAGFNQDGLCTGQVQIGKEKTSLVLFGDDAYSENKDGLTAGENINYRLYRPEENRYFDLELTWDANHQAGNTFLAHGISVASSIKLSGVGISTVDNNNISIYPNPTTGTVHISGIQGEFTVEIYTAVRKRIHQANLTGEAQVNLSSYPKGIYMLKITTNDFSYTEKVVLN